MTSFFKKTIAFITFLSLCFTLSTAYAQGDPQQLYEDSVKEQGIKTIQQAKDEATLTLDILRDRIQNIPRNDGRRQEALEQIKVAEEEVDTLKGLNNLEHVELTPSVGSAPPMAEFSQDFLQQQQRVEEAFSAVNLILIQPPAPENVPSEDVRLLETFIPQLVRQFFRFAWLAVFVSFIVSGVMFVMAFGNDERTDKAKKITYMSIIGFAFVALSFAIVSAITDIDFFRFI